MVALSETYASVVEFDGNTLPPPLLSSSNIMAAASHDNQ